VKGVEDADDHPERPGKKIELIRTGSYTALSTLGVVASVADRSGLCVLRPLHRESGDVSYT
jgi:hypothetical protein